MKHPLCGAAPLSFGLGRKGADESRRRSGAGARGRVARHDGHELAKDQGGRPGLCYRGDNLPARQGRLREIPRTIFSRRSKESEHQAAPDNREVLRPDQAVASWSYG